MEEGKGAVSDNEVISDNEDLVFEGSPSRFDDLMEDDEVDEDRNLPFDDFDLENVDVELIELDEEGEIVNRDEIIDLSDDVFDDINIELEFTRGATFRSRETQRDGEGTESSREEGLSVESTEDLESEMPSQSTRKRKRPCCSSCGRERVLCNKTPCSVVQQRKKRHLENKVTIALMFFLMYLYSLRNSKTAANFVTD